MNELTETTSAKLVLFSQDVLSLFLTSLDTAEKTKETYRKDLTQFFHWLEKKGITVPRREDVLLFKQELKEEHAPSTVNGYLTAVRAFFSWLASKGLFSDVSSGIKGTKQPQTAGHDALTAHQVCNLLKVLEQDRSLEGKRNFLLVLLLVSDGLRTCEAVRADLCDIRHNGTRITLAVQGKGCDSKDRVCVLNGKTLDALEVYLTARRESGENLTERSPLFISHSDRNRGQRLSTQTVSKTVKKALRLAGYDNKRLTAHSLRHTAVTFLLESGESVQAVQTFARHKNVNTTLRYAHNLQEASYNGSEIISEVLEREA